MLTIGVLGANGFVGCRIVEKFHLEGVARVVPIVRNYAGLARTSRFALDARIADVLDREALTTAFRGCDMVVHAVLGPWNQITSEPPVVYRAAEDAGVRRLVYISTASVHGQAPEPGTDESSRLRTDQLVSYNNAKVRAEIKFRSLRQRGRVELVMLRPGIVFGPRDIWINGIARTLVLGEAYLVDGGTGICNTVYIDNLVHAVQLALNADVDGEVFLIGDNEPITWAEIYHLVAAALGHQGSIPVINDPPTVIERRELVDRLRSYPALKALFRRIPQPIKDFGHRQIKQAKLIRTEARKSRVEATEWVLPDADAKRVPLEVALLHRCRYKFPFTKARAKLGYEPIVSVEEGLMRSISALRFAGFAVDSRFEELLRSHATASASTTAAAAGNPTRAAMPSRGPEPAVASPSLA